MAAIFTTGQCLVVTTRGPGKVHLLCYQNNSGPYVTVGSTPTTNAGVTRFMISFSHSFEKFAFYWDGTGEAVYGIGTDLRRSPVGKSWSKASLVAWGATTVTTADVTSFVPQIENTVCTCFVIPDKI